MFSVLPALTFNFVSPAPFTLKISHDGLSARAVSRPFPQRPITMSTAHPPDSTAPRGRGGPEGMCQPRQQPGRQRPAWAQVAGCIARVWRHAIACRWVWLKSTRPGKGETGRRPGERVTGGDAVELSREASSGHFSRTATVTGSFVAHSRCCDKDGEECRGGISHQTWGPDEGVWGESVGLTFERGRSLARNGRGRNGRVVYRSSGTW